ncbi:unnamed protein product [Didymodactylos carnosus]|uniref:Uncharacterized protein n=1 Tax=Didymodactylos carnosus TaxID=1234261 RepID=A0A815R7F0_9BILA|nr:unnamed protein product [Didymodactylos carnosus]CAF4340504.1 unnamed protein product [Didymodactylos carnosus]
MMAGDVPKKSIKCTTYLPPCVKVGIEAINDMSTTPALDRRGFDRKIENSSEMAVYIHSTPQNTLSKPSVISITKNSTEKNGAPLIDERSSG